MTIERETNLYVPEPSQVRSVMEKPCNLCHKTLLVLEAEHDREWGWCHRSCVNSISTVGS